MDPLAHPHWEAIPLNVRRVMENLARATALEPFYLAGGTALALRLGHRLSVDLDFFGEVETFGDDWRRRMIRELAEHFETDVTQNSLWVWCWSLIRYPLGFLRMDMRCLIH